MILQYEKGLVIQFDIKFINNIILKVANILPDDELMESLKVSQEVFAKHSKILDLVSNFIVKYKLLYLGFIIIVIY